MSCLAFSEPQNPAPGSISNQWSLSPNYLRLLTICANLFDMKQKSPLDATSSLSFEELSAYLLPGGDRGRRGGGRGEEEEEERQATNCLEDGPEFGHNEKP